MTKVFHFLRLIRFLNLMVMAFTMYAVQFFILKYSNLEFVFDLHFFLLVTSVLLIAAAGNIINDYFDVKADRINKPDRLIVGKFIKRRWAIMLNWIFNLTGFVVAVYISLQCNQFLISLMAGISIVSLWLYSMKFKKMEFLGNIVVAFLVALVPIYVLMFYDCELNQNADVFNAQDLPYVRFVIWSFAGCAFFINWIRELTKDIFDIQGDKRINAHTFPIKYGVKGSKILISIISIIFITYLGIVYSKYLTFLVSIDSLSSVKTFSFQVVMLVVMIAFLISFFIGIIISMTAKALHKYKLSAKLYKVSMLAGVILFFFL